MTFIDTIALTYKYLLNLLWSIRQIKVTQLLKKVLPLLTVLGISLIATTYLALVLALVIRFSP